MDRPKDLWGLATYLKEFPHVWVCANGGGGRMVTYKEMYRSRAVFKEANGSGFTVRVGDGDIEYKYNGFFKSAGTTTIEYYYVTESSILTLEWDELFNDISEAESRGY